MKKITTILMLLMLTCMGATAQVYVTETGQNMLSLADMKAGVDAGDFYVSMQQHQTNTHNYINSQGKLQGSYNTDGTTAWKVEKKGSNYVLKSVATGKYISSLAGSNGTAAGFSDNIANALEFNPVQSTSTDGNIASGYTTNQSIWWNIASNTTNRLNTMGSNNIFQNGGTGIWTCIFTYKVTLKYNIVYKCYMQGDTEPFETVTSTDVYADGETVTITEAMLPGFMGKAVATFDNSVTINGANAEVNVYYTASTFNYTIVNKNLPEGTTIAIKGEPVNEESVSFNEAVVWEDVVVTFPPSSEKVADINIIVNGANATITIEAKERWWINFPKDQKYTRTDRFINNVRIGSTIFPITNNGLNSLAYRDFTDQVLVVPAGATLVPAIGYEGAWMHGFFYVDLNNDGVFHVANPNHITPVNTEYNGELLSYGNEGNALNKDKQEMPAFTMPTTPGDYRARFKMDWASTDPGGNPGADPADVSSSNHIIANGGIIVDITLRISDPCDLLPAEIQNATAIYNNVKDNAGELGYPKTDVVNALKQALDAAEASTGENCAELIGNLIAAAGAVTSKENRVMPEIGKFYRIKGVNGGRYMQSTVSTTAAAGKVGTRLGATETADASTIFYLDTEKKLLGLKNRMYVTNTCDFNSNVANNSAGATKYTFNARDEYGKFAVKNGGTFLYLWDGETNYCVDRQGSDHVNCVFTIEEVTELPITLNVVGDKSYATFYSPVAISQVNGAEVYVVNETKDNSVVIEKATAQAIPAGKGVMLVSDDKSASATLTIGEAGDFETGLNGVTASEQITKDTDPYNSNLFLSKKDGKIGFYKIKTTENVGVTGGFKAYLSTAAGAKEGFELEFGGVTGIENMEHGTLNMENGAVYNLQGQRVNKAQKGVFIQNGKKVVLK